MNLTEVEIRPGLRLCSAPALFVEDLRVVIVADVHWGYAASQRAAGRLVPRWGDDDIDARLTAAVRHYQPRALIIAGDVVHARAGSLAAQTSLARLAGDTRVVLVTGNHDRRSAFAEAVRSYHEADIFVHHGDEALDVPPGALEIIGHHHPAATWHDGAGAYVKLPALVEGARRLILPAFSPWAGGVPWNHRLAADEWLWFIGPQRIFRAPRSPSERGRRSSRTT